MESEKNKEIKERIRGLRREKNYSQEQVADMVNLSTNSYREIESGKTFILNKNLSNIAEALGVSLDYLLVGQESPESSQHLISKVTKEYEDRLNHLTLHHSIEVAEKGGEIEALKAKLESSRKIIGALKGSVDKRY